MEEKKSEQRKPLDLESAKKVIQALQEKYFDLKKKYEDLQSNFKGIDFTVVRLNMLFKVLDHSDKLDPEFVEDCCDEIKELMVIPKEEEKVIKE